MRPNSINTCRRARLEWGPVRVLLCVCEADFAPFMRNLLELRGVPMGAQILFQNPATITWIFQPLKTPSSFFLTSQKDGCFFVVCVLSSLFLGSLAG